MSVPVQTHTSVPIPEILDWSDNSSNIIGCEYIIMEHARGVQLHEKWPSMSVEQQINCIKTIAQNIKQTAALDFPAYGSLYFSNGPKNLVSNIPVGQEFCIGPNCRTRYWDIVFGETRNYTSVDPNRGPCKLPDAPLDQRSR